MIKKCPSVLLVIWRLPWVAWKMMLVCQCGFMADGVHILKIVESSALSQFWSIFLFTVKGKIFFDVLAGQMTKYISTHQFKKQEFQDTQDVWNMLPWSGVQFRRPERRRRVCTQCLRKLWRLCRSKNPQIYSNYRSCKSIAWLNRRNQCNSHKSLLVLQDLQILHLPVHPSIASLGPRTCKFHRDCAHSMARSH